MPGPAVLRVLPAALCLSLAAPGAAAWRIAITPGPPAAFLQVGTGSFLGTYSAGGTPLDNATINVVSINVPAASLGAGTLAMTSDSAAAASPFDGFAFCGPPDQVYIGGFFRRPNAGANATLSVSTPPTLQNGAGATLPFGSISWVSGGNRTSSLNIPSGAFTGANQFLVVFPRNSWVENCLRFSYANTAFPLPGTYTGRATYTLTTP
jgi:hypothetical protein